MNNSLDIWQDIIHSIGYNYLIGIPCSHISNLFNVKDISIIIPPREDDAIGLAAGLNIFDRKCLVAVQSSGFGNCINSLETFIIPYGFNIDIIVSCRSGKNEKNPAQVLMGELVQQIVKKIPACVYKESDYTDLKTLFQNINKNSINVILKGC